MDIVRLYCCYSLYPCITYNHRNIHIFPCVLQVSMIPKSIVRMGLPKYVIRALNINFVLLFPVFQNTIKEKIRTYLMMTISCEVSEHIRTYTIYSRFSQHSMYCRFLVGFHVFSSFFLSLFLQRPVKCLPFLCPPLGTRGK